MLDAMLRRVYGLYREPQQGLGSRGPSSCRLISYMN